MQLILALLLSVTMLPTAFAGDDASGPVHFQVDLSRKFTTYSMSAQDELWSATLALRFAYKGRPLHFVRTSLPLRMGEKVVQGAVYQAVERPDVFYIAKGDAMLKLGSQWAYNPGVGGFSMHSPKSQNFIVCFNFAEGGVPFLSSSVVQKGIVTWSGHDDWDRLK